MLLLRDSQFKKNRKRRKNAVRKNEIIMLKAYFFWCEDFKTSNENEQTSTYYVHMYSIHN